MSCKVERRRQIEGMDAEDNERLDLLPLDPSGHWTDLPWQPKKKKRGKKKRKNKNNGANHEQSQVEPEKDSDQDKQQTMFRINDEAKVQAWAAEVKAGTDHNKIPLVVMPAGHRQRICKTSGQEIEVQTLKGTSSIQREVLPCFPLEPHAVPTPPRSLHPSLPAKEPSWTVSQQQDLVKIETAQAAKLEQQEMARQQKAESVGSRQSLASPKENNIESKSHQRPLYQPQKACPFPAALTSAKLPTEQDMAVDASMLAGFLKDLGICDPECQRWQIKKERQKSTAKQRPAKHSIGQPGHSNSEEICSAGGHICYG